MPCIPHVSAAVLLSCTAISAAGGAQKKQLPNDQVTIDKGFLRIHPVADLKQTMAMR
jgi:hypothetical protein